MSKPLGKLGHGNGSANGNKASVASDNSFLNWKPTAVHIHQHESSTANKLLLVGVGIALGAAAVFGAKKTLDSPSAETPMSSGDQREEAAIGGGTTDQSPQDDEVVEETVHMSAKTQLELLNKATALSLRSLGINFLDNDQLPRYSLPMH
ncbi:MAG: hypothetical protein M1839_009276 [Geoglossum umbratile]|nr:MAG: hypothetical protein M1839_009276 [Geoglossum umbratile]